MLTDPQNDAKCRDCGALTQHASERCDDCRTPAGRLVTALAAAGIEDVNHDSSITASVGCLTIEVYEDDPERWTIEGFDGDGITAVDAIAAIVQAPGLRTERDALAAENARLRSEIAEMKKPEVDVWETTTRCYDGRVSVAFACPSHFIPGNNEAGWWAQHPDGTLIASGPETGDAGRHAADLALVAAGYRLIGGVWPAQGEVSDAR